MTTTTTALERVTDDVFSDIELRTLAGHRRWTSLIAGSTCCTTGWTLPRCSPARGSSTPGGRSTDGLISPRSSGCSTRIAGIRPLTVDSTTSKRCCNAPSMKSSAHNQQSTTSRTLTITRISTRRAGDLYPRVCLVVAVEDTLRTRRGRCFKAAPPSSYELFRPNIS
jgi:hypothetical protein